MSFRLQYVPKAELPKLGWLAEVDTGAGQITVTHGPAVECRDQWAVEGVWDGDFVAGDFHQSEAFFGSGVRLDGQAAHFPASTGSVDRILFCRTDGRYLVSNSLVLMLARTGARLDDHHDYWRECLSVFKGVDRFDDRFVVVHPTIDYFHQVFYENLIIGPEGVRFGARTRSHDFRNFEDYSTRLREALERIKDNLTSPDRDRPLVALTTVSEGYDSTAVSALVKDIGITKCFAGERLDRPWEGLIGHKWREQSGPIVDALGLEPIAPKARRDQISEDELYFLATNYPKRHSGHWSEIGHHPLTSFIQDNCPAAAVFTGYHGDLLWTPGTHPKYIHPKIRRQCLSGLNLSEIRLKAGFIHVAVPFIFANDIERIQAITASPEMAPWRLGGDYDRPIPRRIAEEAGVKRGDFAREKKFLSDRYLWPVNRRLRREFFTYLKTNHGIGRTRLWLEHAMHFVPMQWLMRKMGIALPRRDHYFFGPEIDFFYLMNHWATARLAQRTAPLFEGS
jgi:hypothetical protein